MSQYPQLRRGIFLLCEGMNVGNRCMRGYLHVKKGPTTLYGHAVGKDRVPCGAGRLPVVPYTMACQKSRLLGKHRLYHP